jgi:UDP-3-O-[3-hydroxymyristoyl] glucosamine N-acyltransferase
MSFTAVDIADRVEGTVHGDGSIELTGFAPADAAQAGDLTFAENEAYFALAEASAASAILVPANFTSRKKVLIAVPNARVAFAKALSLFFPEPVVQPGIHPTAVIDDSAEVDATAHVGPYCVIGPEVRIGARSSLHALNHVGAKCRLGDDVQLFPQVILYARTEIGNRVRIHSGTVIGSDGFGYVLDEGVQKKVPQIGNVVIHDDVEIGANVTVDRGALGSTTIGKGTKIDNLVQIAHNVVIGENCVLVSQVGIAGSTRLGNFVTLAGQVGLTQHLNIADGVTIAAQSGVMHDIGPKERWFGSPAKPARQAMRQLVALEQLPDLLRRVSELEKLMKAPRAKPSPSGEATDQKRGGDETA